MNLYDELRVFFELPLVASITKMVIVVTIGIAFMRIIDGIMKFAGKKIGTGHHFMNPVGRVLKSIVIIGVLVIGLSSIGIGLDGLWTFLTTVMALIAVGFIAVWSVLSNFVCALLILANKPFQVGDEVSFPGEQIKGRVADLTFAYTTLQGDDGAMFRVPNNHFFQKSILCKPMGPSPRSLAEQFRSESPAEF